MSGHGSVGARRDRRSAGAGARVFLPVTLALCVALPRCGDPAPPARADAAPRPVLSTTALPAPDRVGSTGVETALAQRRSRRDFAVGPPSILRIGQVLWAAQGITDDQGHRTAPSAGGSYPLRLYLVTGDVDGLPTGLHRYRPGDHALDRLTNDDLRGAVVDAAGQEWLRAAPVLLVLAADLRGPRERFGEDGVRHVYVEAGAAAENVYLQCETIGMATRFVGGFDATALAASLELPADETPIGILPLGNR